MPGPELETHMAEQNYGKRMTSIWNTLSRRFVGMVNGTCFFFFHLKREFGSIHLDKLESLLLSQTVGLFDQNSEKNRKMKQRFCIFFLNKAIR